MKHILLLSIIMLGNVVSADAQGIKFFIKEFTLFDSVNSVSDWKTKYLNNTDINIYRNQTDLTLRMSNPSDYTGWLHEKYNMTYKQIPIEYATLKVHKKDGTIRSINGEYFENLNLSVIPTISITEALDSAKAMIGAITYDWSLSNMVGELVVCKDYLNDSDNVVCLAYKFSIVVTAPISHYEVYVNAHTSKVVNILSMYESSNATGTAQTKNAGTQTIITDLQNGLYLLKDYTRGNGIETNNLNKGTDLTTAVEFIDNDNNWTIAEYHNTNKDDASLDIHWGVEKTYDYFLQLHNRNSLDNNGFKIKSYVHYGNNYQNASWDRDKKIMSYGDGDGINTTAFSSLDVTAHELGHGINTFSAQLASFGEPGALNEGMSDLWGACVEAKYGYSDVWSINEQFDLTGGSLTKHLYNPKIDGNPNTYEGDNWGKTKNNGSNNDYGNKHKNAGVLHYWFYLLSQGGSGTNDNNTSYNVTGITIQKSEKIIYKALTDYFTPNTGYLSASLLTTFATAEIFDICSEEMISVRNAWKAVGLEFTITVPNDLIITETVATGTASNKIAINNILASNTIESGANAVYKAGNIISLKSNFKASAGANFKAYVKPCAPNFDVRINSRVANGYKNNFENNNTLEPSNTHSIHNPYTITLYPNPTQNTLTVQLASNSDFATIYIYNSIGQLVSTKYNVKHNFEIDVSQLIAGIYSLQMVTENMSKTFKITKL